MATSGALVAGLVAVGVGAMLILGGTANAATKPKAAPTPSPGGGPSVLPGGTSLDGGPSSVDTGETTNDTGDEVQGSNAGDVTSSPDQGLIESGDDSGDDSADG